MRPLGAIEKAGAALGLLLVIVGVASAIFPKAGVITHASERFYFDKTQPPSSDEHVSKRRARVYGILAAAFRAGILWVAVYRPDK